MLGRIIVCSSLLIAVTACGSPSREVFGVLTPIAERGPGIQDVQLSQSLVLPPYGVKITAQSATLTLHISSSQEGATARFEDVQGAVDVIDNLAAKNANISSMEVSVSQVASSYAARGTATPAPSNIQNLDTSVVTIKLTSALAQYDYDFAKSIAAFNDFLNAVTLPPTITLRPISIEADLGDLEQYRSQIIDRVYHELDAVQGEYGDTAKFEISGLYDPLKKLQLNDVEYYLYLEPIVIVREF